MVHFSLDIGDLATFKTLQYNLTQIHIYKFAMKQVL